MKSIIIFLFIISNSIFSQFIFVPDDYSTIQEAIDTSSDGDTIVIREGTYNENLRILYKDLTIASEYLIDSNEIHIANTIIDGSNVDNVVEIFSSSDSLSIIGLTIQNGRSVENDVGTSNGGGIKCHGNFDLQLKTYLLLQNLILKNNYSVSNGGGIYLYNTDCDIVECFVGNNTAKYSGPGIQVEESKVLFNNSRIELNTPQNYGSGGVSCFNSNFEAISSNFSHNNGSGLEFKNSISTMDNCQIRGNITSENGGGISANSSDLFINDCRIDSNKSNKEWGYGGAINFFNENSNSTDTNHIIIIIINTTFIDNYSLYKGGGVYVSKSDNSTIEVDINKCNFTTNYAKSACALYLRGNNLFFEVNECVFDSNFAEQYGAGATFQERCVGSVEYCIFSRNIALNAGGVSVWDKSEVDFQNCTFVNNLADYGSGINIGKGGKANIVNTIFWDNSIDQIGLVNYNSDIPTLTINYSCVQNGIDSIYFADSTEILNWGNNNLTSNPLFCNSSEGIFTLAENSPCIGTGKDGEDIGVFGIGCGVVSVNEENNLPTEYQLLQNYPNPFNPATVISYSIPKTEFVKIAVYDILGREVAKLVNEVKQVGNYEVNFKAENLSSGIYFYTLRAGNFVETKKMLLLS